MIFYDTITVKFNGGGQRTVRGIVTFLDSSRLLSQDAGISLLNSRFRIVLSPSGDPLPAGGVTLAWRNFPSLLVEGAIEPHYRRGRLHHYECVAKAL